MLLQLRVTFFFKKEKKIFDFPRRLFLPYNVQIQGVNLKLDIFYVWKYFLIILSFNCRWSAFLPVSVVLSSLCSAQVL